ncbi:LemA family protein [Pelagerythrobacter marinus]|uniref:LemA family protein n=1 Tax=Pelagerythrobacter marinus TaxID=538382 RepID=UPI002036A14B|nr:LemA family protein [Pelagerythrobacter marinus]USA38620.1 LemA family protein [Pelagerythrobacter marinus]WPZ07354.1 LemA family protein [Pelagerythrobacter marinus]
MNWKSVRRFSLVALASLGLAACGINSVPAAEENAKAKWADVQAAFQERANLIPNLEQIVLSSAEQERETFNQVIEARASATRPEIQVDGADLSNPEAMAQYQQAQSQLGSALSRLLVSVERYPELRSQENFGRFMTQIEGQENRIRVAIRDYNEAVRQYNTTIRTFPDTIGANLIHGAGPMVPYEAVSEGAEVAPTLNMRAGGNGAAAGAGANDNAADQPAAAAAN